MNQLALVVGFATGEPVEVGEADKAFRCTRLRTSRQI